MSFENMEDLCEYIRKSDNPYFKEFEIDNFDIIIPKYKEPSNLRISTMTYTANLNTRIDLQTLYDLIEINNNDYPNIISCEYGNNIPKGRNIKPKKKYFANQLTLKVQYNEQFKVNLKLFNNGKIGITGCKDDDITKNILEYLVDYIKILNKKKKFFDENELKLDNINIVLINSDFTCNFELKRNILFKILEKMNLCVSYEPDIYPGVKIKFYYNKTKDIQNGICNCSKLCKGKSNGDSINNCKKITILIFQSGSIIITGAINHLQKIEAYNFINNIIKSNYDNILKYN